jgi:predicted dehydrogenase
MSDYLNTSVLLVGAGKMAIAYTKVLQALNLRMTVVGRCENTALAFQQVTGVPAASGGLEQWLLTHKSQIPTAAIVAVSINQLKSVTAALIEAGVKRILVEKPAGVDGIELQYLSDLATKSGADVRVAYNRRFLASVLAARQACQEDGGLLSMHFEFTEWTSRIGQGSHPDEVLANWFLANSTHVVDLAMFLGGTPVQISSFVARGLDWHPQASVFSGAGITDSGTLFSYHANWESAGRWGIELRTRKRRLLLCPLEELQEQIRDTIVVTGVDIDDRLDREFKPGFYRQAQAFLQGQDIASLPTIQEHAQRNEKIYQQIVSGPATVHSSGQRLKRVA